MLSMFLMSSMSIPAVTMALMVAGCVVLAQTDANDAEKEPGGCDQH